MGRASREKREKRDVEAKAVAEPLRYIVKSDTWEAEVLVEGGTVMTADEPLEDYVGDPWDALADHARGHGWKVRDKAAQAGEPPKLSALRDPVTAVIDEASTIAKDQFLKLPIPKIVPPKRPPGIAKHLLIGDPSSDMTWQTPINEIEEKMKVAEQRRKEQDAEMKRLVQEFAVRQAQQGNIDAMNAAIFPPVIPAFTAEQLRVVQRIVEDAVEREIMKHLGRTFEEKQRRMEEEVKRREIEVTYNILPDDRVGPVGKW